MLHEFGEVFFFQLHKKTGCESLVYIINTCTPYYVYTIKLLCINIMYRLNVIFSAFFSFSLFFSFDDFLFHFVLYRDPSSGEWPCSSATHLTISSIFVVAIFASMFINSV